MLLEDNDKDKRLLRQLEKNLKMKKRKSNSLPLAFVNDGLDCILYIEMRMNIQVLKCQVSLLFKCRYDTVSSYISR